MEWILQEFAWGGFHSSHAKQILCRTTPSGACIGPVLQFIFEKVCRQPTRQYMWLGGGTLVRVALAHITGANVAQLHGNCDVLARLLRLASSGQRLGLRLCIWRRPRWNVCLAPFTVLPLERRWSHGKRRLRRHRRGLLGFATNKRAWTCCGRLGTNTGTLMPTSRQRKTEPSSPQRTTI